MNLQKCENGHFYDADKYQTCPHCQQMNDDQKTIGMTVPNDQPAPSVTPTMPQQPFAYAGGNTPNDDQKTVGIFSHITDLRAALNDLTRYKEIIKHKLNKEVSKYDMMRIKIK